MEKYVDDCNGGISPLLYTCMHVASHNVTLTLATRARRLQAQQTNEQPSRLTGLRCNMTRNLITNPGLILRGQGNEVAVCAAGVSVVQSGCWNTSGLARLLQRAGVPTLHAGKAKGE